MKKNIIIIAIFLLPLIIKAQDVVYPNIKFNSLAQMYFSYAEAEVENDDNPFGFTLRRLRFKPHGDITKNIKWGFQFAFDKQSVKLLDVYVNFAPKKYLNIKVGQFAVPGAKSGAIADELFSTSKMLCIERSTVTQKWLGYTGLNSYRAVGLQIDGKVLEDKLYYGVMVSNPIGNSLFTPSIKQTGYNHDDNGISLWGRVEYKPIKGLGIGGFGSYGSLKSKIETDIGTETDTISMTSYGAHVAYRKKNIVFMTEYIAGIKETNGNELKYNGYYIDFSYKIKKIEPTIRYEYYTPNVDGEDGLGVKRYNNYTVGVNFYPYKRIRLQANYVFKTEDMSGNKDQLTNNLFYIQLQYAISSVK